MQNLLGGNGRLEEDLGKALLPVTIEDRILEEHALGVGKDERKPQVERGLVEDRELAGSRLVSAAHHGQQRRRILERLPHLARQNFGHQPGGLAFHDGEARGGPVIALAARLDELREIEVLVGDGVGDLVGEHGLLGFRGRSVGDEELLPVVVVEGGGLFGEQLDGVFG